MSAVRPVSIIRRKPNLVDLVTPIVQGQDQYKFKWASNFDGSFTTFLTTTNTGYVDPSVDLRQQSVMPGNNVRAIFDPATFSIPDTAPFWLQYVPVTGGIDGTASGLLLVLPPTYGNPVIALSGTAPSAANQAGSLRLDLPRLATDLRIQNLEASRSLMVAFDAGGPEITLKAPDTGPQFVSIQGAHASIWVRGSGGTAAFAATFTFAFPK
jgi:hypothetical protein